MLLVFRIAKLACNDDDYDGVNNDGVVWLYSLYYGKTSVDSGLSTDVFPSPLPYYSLLEYMSKNLNTR